MNYPHLQKKHPKLARILAQETKRQESAINLIASENFASDAVLEALATPFTNKYAEGYAGKRYYFGNDLSDAVETSARDSLLRVFRLSPRTWSVNVQPYSGSTANFAVYAGLLKPGDKVLAMALDQGGHLTHGHSASFTSKVWHFVHYGVEKDGRIDYDVVAKLARTHKPKLIICGGSAYARTIDFKKFSRIAKRAGALLMVDMSHFAGLVAGGAHPSPFPYADVVTTTTHKTLRGPRAALIFLKQALGDAIDKALFPGLQGGPHLNTIFSVAVMAEEALKPNFKTYARQIVKNAQVLAKALANRGFTVITGGTDTHLMLIDVTSLGYTGKTAGELLERAGIIVNKNAIPNDSRKPWDPSGIRLGTPAMTTRGMKEKEMRQIAAFISEVLIDHVAPARVRKNAEQLMKKFRWRS